jgi:pimeloyl-ACP methyl ester carboxylesterase
LGVFRRDDRDGQREWWFAFVAGLLAGGAGMAVRHAMALRERRRPLDPRLIRRPSEDRDVPPTVVVPGIMGTGLLRPDGVPVWLNLRNAVGHFNLSLPIRLPIEDSRDELKPGGLLGTDAFLPRLFGFTEYYDLIALLVNAGFRPARNGGGQPALAYHVFAYDWRRDIVESVRQLHETLEQLADERGEPDVRFNLVGHSMGGLIARYYLRYGTAEPREDAPVTWAGARRIQNLVLVATPNGGGIHALEVLLYGNKVGLSQATLSAPVIARMPAVYQLMPPKGAAALVDQDLQPLDVDLHDIETWRRFKWGPFAPDPVRRLTGFTEEETQGYGPFLEAVLNRAGALHRALTRKPDTPCPVKVVVLGGDCLSTQARGLVPGKVGLPPRFQALNRAEAEALFEAGDGRVTRSSVLASHLPAAEESELGCGLPEVTQAFFGSADHHGIYGERTFQSILLRLLLRRAPRPAAPGPRTRADDDLPFARSGTAD